MLATPQAVPSISAAVDEHMGDDLMSDTLAVSNHVVFVTWPAVGHVTPLMDCASAFLEAQPNAFVSFLTSPDMVDYLQHSGKCSVDHQKRLRVIPVGTEALGDNPLGSDGDMAADDRNPMEVPRSAKSHDKNQTVMKTLRAATQIALHCTSVKSSLFFSQINLRQSWTCRPSVPPSRL